MASRERSGFIGKERDDESDLGVRKYDFLAGRFTSPDPLWEKYYSLTPYQYSMNNPMVLFDNNGLAVLSLNVGGRVSFIGSTISLSFGLAADTKGNIGGTATVGVGTGVGLGGNVGVSVGVSGAQDIPSLNGSTSVSAGAWAAFGAEGGSFDVGVDTKILESQSFSDVLSNLLASGSGGKIGPSVGLGVGAHAELTYTGSTVFFNAPALGGAVEGAVNGIAQYANDYLNQYGLSQQGHGGSLSPLSSYINWTSDINGNAIEATVQSTKVQENKQNNNGGSGNSINKPSKCELNSW